jgi:hypothetical protein
VTKPDGVDGMFSDAASATQAADYRNGVRAAAAILLGLVVLCALASLPGCVTPAKLVTHSDRMEVLSAAATSPRCAEAAYEAQRAILALLESQAVATTYLSAWDSRRVTNAVKAAEEACK